MGDALQDEVPDGELRSDLHRAATATRTFRDPPIEDLATQEDERDISGLIEHPTAWGIGGQKRELARARAGANGSPIERPLQLHTPAIVDAVGGNSECGKAHVNRAHAKARCGNGRPAALQAGKRFPRIGKPMHGLQSCPFRPGGHLSTMEPLARKGRTPSPRRPSTRRNFPKTPTIARLTWQQKGRNIITRSVRRTRLGRTTPSWRPPVPAPGRALGAEEDDGASLVVLLCRQSGCADPR